MRDKIDVVLTWGELMQAAVVGSMRRVSSLQRSLNTYKHAKISNWSTDIDGAAAEMAVSKAMQRYWSGHTLNFHGDDVLGGLQVRSTNYENGQLIIRNNDKDNSPYILVISTPPVFSIRGYLIAKDAKQDKYFKKSDDGAEAWWIPQNDLKDISGLIQKVAA